MKYRQRLVSSCTPASLQEWLAEELERRGIDGVYTRYILSLLLADTNDPAECAHVLTRSRTNPQVHHASENKRGDKSRHRCRLKSWDCKKEQQGLLVHNCQHVGGHCCDCSQFYLDSEQSKKLAAVECLKSASEQKSGIEKLIDEVCAKLKNFQADIETNPDSKLHAEIKDDSKQSPPQEQAELYYTTFPALSGKADITTGRSHEIQTRLQNQEVWSLKTTAWGKEILNCADKPIAVNNEEEVEVQNDLGKESSVEKEESFNCSEVSTNEDSKEVEYFKNVELENEPLFIVPKMRVPLTKVTNVTMYTPFTSAASYQIQKVQGESNQYDGEGKESEEENIKEVEGDVLIAEAKPCLTWKIHLPDVVADENNLVTDLVSKFNSELAAIWETDNHIQESSLCTDNLGFSFRILSVHSPVQTDIPVATPTSVNFLIGSHLPSVWSAKTEDIKILNAHDAFEASEPMSSASLVPGLMHIKEESVTDDDPSVFWSSEDEEDFLLDDKFSLKSCKLDLSDQAWEDLNSARETDSEDRGNLCPDFEEHEKPLGCNSNIPSRLDSSAEVATGVYSLWEVSSPQPPFQMKELLKDAAPYCDKVVNWITNQKNMVENWHDISIWKENRSLTYHKGESRFKEVVPLTKAKAEFEQTEFSENKMSLLLDECSNDLLGKPEEPEENLLTSPKTHFQPIRQDSSESLSESVEAAEAQQVLLSPNLCDPQTLSVIVTPPTVDNKEEDADKDVENGRSVSSSIEEMLYLTGKFDSIEEPKVENIDNLDLLGAFQPNVRPEWLLLADKSTSTDASSFNANNSKDDLGALGFGPFHNDQIWSTDVIDNQCSNLAQPWKWSTRDDSEEVWKVGSLEDSSEESFENVDKKFGSNCTLKAMRRELEEEENEIFRDIKLLSDSEDVEAAFRDDYSLLSVGESWAHADDTFVDACSPTGSQIFAGQWEADSGFEGVSSFLDDSKIEEPEPVELPSIPVEKALYSSELESEWHKTSLAFSIQLPKKGKVKSKAHCQKQQQQQQPQHQQRKPCSFFLEGNCRRSDCKFSHNLGSITCRFWEEGSCFKGETCPFLHGYASDSEFGDITSGKCKFALESEADFPSLSTLSSSEPSSKQSPKELIVGRIIRPKKKKMGPAPSLSAIKKTGSPLHPK